MCQISSFFDKILGAFSKRLMLSGPDSKSISVFRAGVKKILNFIDWVNWEWGKNHYLILFLYMHIMIILSSSSSIWSDKILFFYMNIMT